NSHTISSLYVPGSSSHLVTLVKVEQPVNVWNSVQAPCENSPLFCDQSGHFLFFIDHLCIPINLPLALDTPPIWFAGYRSGGIIQWCGPGGRFGIGPCNMGRLGS
ncbi:hypothetical protein H5410_061958, partial [Solanum commersonii]